MNNTGKTDFDYELDSYEKEILDEIDSGRSKPVPDMQQRMTEVQTMAQEFMKMKRKSIHIRIPEYNLSRIRSHANQQGLPYQTLINSILQQYLEEKEKTPDN